MRMLRDIIMERELVRRVKCEQFDVLLEKADSRVKKKKESETQAEIEQEFDVPDDEYSEVPLEEVGDDEYETAKEQTKARYDSLKKLEKKTNKEIGKRESFAAMVKMLLAYNPKSKNASRDENSESFNTLLGVVDESGSKPKGALTDMEIADLQLFDAGQKTNKSFSTAKEKVLRLFPNLAYDTVVAKRNMVAFNDMLTKAKNRYAMFEPSVVGYNYISRGGVRSAEGNVQKPEKNKKKFLDINKIQKNVWYKWPNAVKHPEAGVYYKKSGEGEEGEEAGSGTGPGESWLAHVFGGKVQGGGVSFDVVMQDGSTWEVKQIKTASETIRPGTEGLKAFEDARQKLVNVVNQLKAFVTVAETSGVFDNAGDAAQHISYIREFLASEYEMIVNKGEISKDRLMTLRTVLNHVSPFLTIRERLKLSKKKQPKQYTVKLNKNEEIPIDKSTYIDVAELVKSKVDDEHKDKAVSDIEEIDIVTSMLRDEAFIDPKKFISDWLASVSVNEVFSQISGGLFVVKPDAFMAIPKEDLSKALKFEKVTQGKPRFVVTVFGTGSPEGAEVIPISRKAKKSAPEEAPAEAPPAARKRAVARA